MNAKGDSVNAGPPTRTIAARPSTEASVDPLHIILDEMRRSERRMENRLRQSEADMHCSQDEAV